MATVTQTQGSDEAAGTPDQTSQNGVFLFSSPAFLAIVAALVLCLIGLVTVFALYFRLRSRFKRELSVKEEARSNPTNFRQPGVSQVEVTDSRQPERPHDRPLGNELCTLSVTDLRDTSRVARMRSPPLEIIASSSSFTCPNHDASLALHSERSSIAASLPPHPSSPAASSYSLTHPPCLSSPLNPGSATHTQSQAAPRHRQWRPESPSASMAAPDFGRASPDLRSWHGTGSVESFSLTENVSRTPRRRPLPDPMRPRRRVDGMTGDDWSSTDTQLPPPPPYHKEQDSQ
ncbi:hypothetical protein EW146_g4445 [Bondarzewia mesenterica]|uniref:Uncharacterized protein n=1 Tax=Bondarzewia mesenterica TaxID=1095465 RepID=A0A4S4LUQ5_9AGAM|nr:hypothetical protein EW146_g4445 [Bondarzewia mesenterica]